MSASYQLERARRGVWPLAVGAVVAVAHIPEFADRLLDGDEAIYGSIAVLMNMGGDLYGSGGVDNKPPGIFWLYALAFRVFGAYQMTAIHAVVLSPAPSNPSGAKAPGKVSACAKIRSAVKT